MFTVIIAKQNIIDVYEGAKMFLKPLFNEAEMCFCPWNDEGESLEEMLPKIYDIVAYKTEWRAVILSEAGLEQINPFDFTGHKENTDKLPLWEGMKQRRLGRFQSFEKSVNNPLTKLTSALCGIPVFDSTILNREEYEKLAGGEGELYEYMLSLLLQHIRSGQKTLSALCREKLVGFAGENKGDALLKAVFAGDIATVLKSVPEEKILSLLQLVSDSDPFYSDPEFVECMLENTKKEELFDTLQEGFTFKDKLPKEVLCLSPRTFDFENFQNEVNWKDNDESRYSYFTEFNLYSNKLKFFVFDVIRQDNNQYKFDQIQLLSFLLLLAGNPLPQNSVRAGRLYRANMEFDSDSIGRFCVESLGKLKSTVAYIGEIDRSLGQKISEPLTNNTARQLFESDEHIPVVVNAEFRKDDLMANYESVGLATDCPHDEKSDWDNQYTLIEKRFVKYLREPRRAVKTAVKDEFKPNNKVEDERAILLTEFQNEDVELRLLEEEQNMVSTVTTQLFDSVQYKKNLDKADKALKEGISKRMSRKKTVLIGLICLLVYLIGFLPMLLGNTNTTKSFVFSLTVTLITVTLLMLVGIVGLIWFRHKLIKLFKGFNRVMGDICSEIEDGLRRFSDYLSHACNVMREFSILNCTKNSTKEKQRILKYHNIKVNEKIDEVSTIFSNYIDSKNVRFADVEPYDYDFTLMRDYDFEIAFRGKTATVEYIQPGNLITLPVDYIKSVSLVREELYD